MKCQCGNKAIYFRRYSGHMLCKPCFNEYFEKKVYDTIRKYHMIKNGERIAVGISGGKDSTALLHILKKLSTKLKITVHPILIDEGIDGYRESGIKSAKESSNTLALPLTQASFREEVGYTLDEFRREGELKPCTYCGIIRRSLLNKKAIDLEMDRLAVGHNLDDEAQVVIMNHLAGDIERLHRLNQKASSKDLLKRIKPLSRLPEKEVMLYAIINNLPFSTSECPYAKDNYRTSVRDFLNNLEKERPGVKFSVVGGWERLVEQTNVQTESIQACGKCGQPSAGRICRACELTEEIKIKMSDAS